LRHRGSLCTPLPIPNPNNQPNSNPNPNPNLPCPRPNPDAEQSYGGHYKRTFTEILWQWLWFRLSFCQHSHAYLLYVPQSAFYSWPVVERYDTNNLFAYLCNVNLAFCNTISFLYIQFHRKSVPHVTTCRNLSIMLLLLCGDIELNPSPRTKLSDQFPCSYNVSWPDRAVCCDEIDECEMWHYKSCHELSTAMYNNWENSTERGGNVVNAKPSTFQVPPFIRTNWINCLIWCETLTPQDISILFASLPSAFNPRSHSSPTAGASQCSAIKYSQPSSSQSELPTQAIHLLPSLQIGEYYH